MLSSWDHQRFTDVCWHQLASAADTILTAALAVAIFILSSLTEDVFLISHAVSFFSFPHLCGSEHGTHSVQVHLRSISDRLRSISDQPHSALCLLFGRNVFSLNAMVELQQLQLAGIANTKRSLGDKIG